MAKLFNSFLLWLEFILFYVFNKQSNVDDRWRRVYYIYGCIVSYTAILEILYLLIDKYSKNTQTPNLNGLNYSFISIMILVIVYRYQYSGMLYRRLKKNKKHLTLTNSKWFRRAFDTPMLIASAIFLLILFNEAYQYSFCFSSECFYSLYDIYKIPAWLITGGIALSGVASAIHRSEESGKQLSIAQSQYQAAISKNTFDNYIKHKESIVAEFSNLEEAFQEDHLVVRFIHKSTIYPRLYPENNYENLTYDIPDKLTGELLDDIEILKSFSNKDLDASEIEHCLNSYNYIIKLVNVRYMSEIEIAIPGSSSYKLPLKEKSPDNTVAKEEDEFTTLTIVRGFNVALVIIYKILRLYGNKEIKLTSLDKNNFSDNNFRRISSQYFLEQK